MLQLLQVTAQYSNAVLVAILPQISDFAARLDLPVPLPLTAAQVAEFRCRPLKGDIGGYVIFTNHLEVWYQLGHVAGFRTPRCYYYLQDPKDIPKFYGPLNLTKDQALQLARTNILKLGYTLKETFTDQEPEVEMPPRIGTNIVPHYQFRWKDPVFGRTIVRMEVDGSTKMIQELRLLSLHFRRPPPKIAVEPALLDPRPAVTAVASNEFLAVMLPKISEFAKRLQLPIRRPITRSQIDKVEFVDPDLGIPVKLTNGYWFVSWSGAVVEFCAPDTVYGRQPPTLDPFLRPLNEYLGRWRLSESEASDAVRKAITNLGYAVEEFHANVPPDVSKRAPVGNYVVPRYYLRWLTNNPKTGETIALVRAEIDADAGSLKWLQLAGNPVARHNGTARPAWNKIPSGTNRPAAPQMTHDTNAVPYTVDELLGVPGRESQAPRQRATQPTTNAPRTSPSPRPHNNPFE
jgi:hypothetical protein